MKPPVITRKMAKHHPDAVRIIAQEFINAMFVTMYPHSSMKPRMPPKIKDVQLVADSIKILGLEMNPDFMDN